MEEKTKERINPKKKTKQMKIIVLINTGILTHPADDPYESETSAGILKYSRVTQESFLVNFSIRSGEF